MIDFEVDEDIIITFGKYKNTPISRIPASYLQWVLDNVTTQVDLLRVLKRYKVEIEDAADEEKYYLNECDATEFDIY